MGSSFLSLPPEQSHLAVVSYTLNVMNVKCRYAFFKCLNKSFHYSNLFVDDECSCDVDKALILHKGNAMQFQVSF